MKFILVNHRIPLGSPTCAECSRSLVSGYLKAVSTQRKFCDHDCYGRYEARNLLAPWLTASYEGPLDMMNSFAAASCWYSIAFAKVALRVGELATAEISSHDRRRKT
jgi:hypothetical protein